MATLFRNVVGTPNINTSFTPQIASPGKPPIAFYEELEMADVFWLSAQIRTKSCRFSICAGEGKLDPLSEALDERLKQNPDHDRVW